jgi:hypothetical protein
MMSRRVTGSSGPGTYLTRRRRAHTLCFMNGLSESDEDLSFLIRVLMPETHDRTRMMRMLREDGEMLEAMLSDERVFHRLLDDPLSVLSVSPTLFFAILLARVKTDLQRQPFTLEHSKRLSMVLFDAPQVVQLLEDKQLRAYLTELLVSFVRVNSFSWTVRVRPGIWRRVRFSDFDIDSLLRYMASLDEPERFPAYKRIADICLFTLGIFAPADTPVSAQSLLTEGLRVKARRGWDDYVSQGIAFYRLASRHPDIRARELSDVLSTLSEKFTLAVKPLAFISSRYLQPFKENVFFQQ